MPATRPAGPRPALIVLSVIGVGLVSWALMYPSIQSLWQFPVGGFITIMTIGKMFSR